LSIRGGNLQERLRERETPTDKTSTKCVENVSPRRPITVRRKDDLRRTKVSKSVREVLTKRGIAVFREKKLS